MERKGNLPPVAIIGILLILLVLAFSNILTFENIQNALTDGYIDKTSFSVNPIITKSLNEVEYSIIIKNPPEEEYDYFRPQIEIRYEDAFFDTNNWEVSRGYKINLDSLQPGERDVYYVKFNFDNNLPNGRYSFEVLVYDSSGNLLENREDILNVKRQ